MPLGQIKCCLWTAQRKTVAENVSQQGTVPAEGVRVYNRSEYVSDYLLRGNDPLLECAIPPQCHWANPFSGKT